MKIKSFKEFNQKEDTMFEDNNVTTLDMKSEAKHHIQEANEKLSMAADAVYQLKKMADYVELDFPTMSKDLKEHSESILVEIEKIQEKVKKTIALIR